MTQEEWSELKRTERNEEFAPPIAYTKKKEKKTEKDSLTIKKKTQKGKKRKSEQRLESKKDQNSLYSKCDITESDYYNMSVSNSASTKSEFSRKRQRAEIPPPLHFDYFGPSATKVTRKSSEKNDINESIEAGLMFLRKQMEQKQNKRDDVEFFDC